MNVWQIGNFGPAHSTENELCRAMRIRGWTVTTLQENHPGTWDGWTFDGPDRPDLILWTRTWRGNDDQQRECLQRAREASVPTVGYHLDRWWGLARQSEITQDRWPFFDVDVLFTADGHHDKHWADAGVDHVWMPPAVSSLECDLGTPDPRWRFPVVFVGSWGGYHPEWPHRTELAARVAQAGGTLLPRRGQQAIRGATLRDLYASADVVVGDSCLVDGADLRTMTRYCSDRIPETLGRGGFLLHPHVDGVTDGTLYAAGQHLATWTLGDWDELDSQITRWRNDVAGRTEIARRGRQWVLAEHTYTRRMGQVEAVLHERGMI